MNERPTPETDLEHLQFKMGGFTLDFCRKLERERDEAIADRDILRIDAQREAEHHDRMVGELERVYQERDEAREEAGHWKTEYEIVVDRLRGRKHPRDNGIIADDEIIPKLERERDEAMSDLEFRRALYKVLEEANNRLMAANEEAVALARTLKQERDEAREVLREIAEATGFDNIGNWARNKANDALKNKN